MSEYILSGIEPAQGTNDYVFGSLAADNVAAPFQWDLSRLPLDYDLKQFQDRVENQGAENSCVGESAATVLELFKQLRGSDRTHQSAKFCYFNSRNVLASILKQPVQDVGTSAFTLMSTLTHQGICREVTWPRAMPVNDRPSDAAYTQGAQFKVRRYERVGRNTKHPTTGFTVKRDMIADIKVAVYHGMPVLFCVPLAASFFNVRGPLETHPAQWEPVKLYGPNFIGAHAMVIIGWREVAGRTIFIAENSWGPGWGDGGFWGVDAQTLLDCAFDLFTVRSFDGITTDIPMSFYRWEQDCTLRDGRRVTVDVDGIPGQVFRLYQAAFNREPDPSGMGYWIDSGVSLADMAGHFTASAEFADLYGALTSGQFVALLYRNVLGREGDAEGAQFWTGHLEAGRMSRPEVLLSFAQSPENIAATRQSIERGVVYKEPA